MLKGLSALVTEWGLDGIDWDLENFPGTIPDIIAATSIVRTVTAGLRGAHPGLLVSGAPQMTDVYPDYPSITVGFNRFVPLLANINSSSDNNNNNNTPFFDLLMPQMYNTWAAVETLAYAQTYAGELAVGFTVAGGQVPLKVPPVRPWLGYPASRNAAGSGYIEPTAVAAMARKLVDAGNISGLMTWEIGWDAAQGWAFATAVASA
jgi:chitinase